MENEKLTRELAETAIKKIETMNNESAHIYEDLLYLHFIETCSRGEYSLEEVIEVAKILLLTKDMDFDRWYS